MKKLWKRADMSLLFLTAGLILAALMFRYHRVLALVQAGVFVVLFLLQMIYRRVVQQKLLYQIHTVADELDYEKGKAFSALSVACCVTDSAGTILWLNSAFETSFHIDKKTVSCKLQQLLRRDSLDKLFVGRGFKIKCGEQFFAVYSGSASAPAPADIVTVLTLYGFVEKRMVFRYYKNTVCWKANG